MWRARGVERRLRTVSAVQQLAASSRDKHRVMLDANYLNAIKQSEDYAGERVGTAQAMKNNTMK